MFRKSSNNKRKPVAAHFDTLISEKTSVRGDVHFAGGLHVDGRVEGTVVAEEGSDAVLRLSEVGEVVGDVYAPHVVINGTVHGNVYSTEDVELASKAAIHGNVYYNLIEMAMGAAVNGSLLHRKNGGDPAPETRTEATASKASTSERQEQELGDEEDEALSMGTDAGRV